MGHYQSDGGQMSGGTAGQGDYNSPYTPGNSYGRTAYGGGSLSAGSYGGAGGFGAAGPYSQTSYTDNPYEGQSRSAEETPLFKM